MIMDKQLNRWSWPT